MTTRSRARVKGAAIGEGARRRSKYGPLSVFDRLPDEAMPDLAWAFEEVKTRKRPKLEVLAELNERLAARGIEPIKKSTFSARTLWLQAHGDAMLQVRDVTATMVEKLEKAGADNVAQMINEMSKSILFDMVANAQLTDTVSLAMLADVATVLNRLETAHVAAARRAEAVAAARKAAERGGAARGLSAEQVAEIKSKILGIDMTNPPPGQAAWPPRSKEETR